MSPALQRGARILSWTRVVPRVHRQVRFIQIRATPSAEPTVNGDHLPLAGTPSFAESRGMRFRSIDQPRVELNRNLGLRLTDYLKRCAVRCRWRAVLIALGFIVGFAEPVHAPRYVGWIERQGRQCMEPCPEKLQDELANNVRSHQVVSTLSVLEPFRRAPLGVPFLYQKVDLTWVRSGRIARPWLTKLQVSSASPVTALISTRSPTTSFAVVNLNGSVDWMVSQRRALLAWTGRSLSVKPTIDASLVRILLVHSGLGSDH